LADLGHFLDAIFRPRNLAAAIDNRRNHGLPMWTCWLAQAVLFHGGEVRKAISTSPGGCAGQLDNSIRSIMGAG
jgi:hypothetical protein